MIRKFHLRIESGKLVDSSRRIASYVQSRRDGECVLTIATGVDAEDPKRSTRQNRYYWGVVVDQYLAAMIDTGDTTIEDLRRELRCDTLADALHELLLFRFAGCEVIDRDSGEIIRLPGRSSRMNTREIGVYWDKIRDDAADKYGVDITPPPLDVFDEL